MQAPLVRIVHFTDPACPWAFSAEPERLRVLWHYGDQVEIDTRLVVLWQAEADVERAGVTPERFAGMLERARDAHGMPIKVDPRPRHAPVGAACVAAVAVRRNAPERFERHLRELRRLAMEGALLDEPATLAAAAERCGLDAREVEAWAAAPEAAVELEEHMRDARTPSQIASALPHRLGRWPGGLRYPVPSYELSTTMSDCRFSAPGMQPWATLETALVNLAPMLQRRDAAASTIEALEWAGMPLATVEVAALCDRAVPEVREELTRAAAFTGVPGSGDGYWSLA